MRHLIDPLDFSQQEIASLLDLADRICADPAAYQDVAAHKKLATLFYEPSTRTRLSFEAAMLNLGGHVLGFPSETVSSAFDIIRPIPALAWIPLMILWLGIGYWSKVGIIFFAAFISATINSYAGIKRTSQVHLWVASTFGATNMQMLFKVAIPTALPMIFTGLRLALGSSWVALVAAELLAATRGLGYMIQVARMLGRPDVIIVGMITIGVVGYLLSTILEWLQTKFVKGGKK